MTRAARRRKTRIMPRLASLPARHPAEHRHDAAPGGLPRRAVEIVEPAGLRRLRPQPAAGRARLPRPGRDHPPRSSWRAFEAWRPGAEGRGSSSPPPRPALPYTDFAFRAGRRHAARPRIGRRAGRGPRGRGRPGRDPDAAGPALAQRRGLRRDDPRRGAAADRRLPKRPRSRRTVGRPDDRRRRSHRLKAETPVWFAALRDRICAAFEALEDEAARAASPRGRGRPGRFERKPWERTRPRRARRAAAASMSMMRGRVFEKVGVHVSTVHGEFAPEFRGQIPGSDRGPALLGGRDLAHRPSLEPERADRAHEHPLRRDDASPGSAAAPTSRRCSTAAARRRTRTRSPSTPPCAAPATGMSPGGALRALQAWCDEYFFLKHRNEPRGVGGIFYDYHWTGDPDERLRLHARRRRGLPRGLSGDRAPQSSDGLDRGRPARAAGRGAAATSSSTCSTTAARSSG